jgi:N-acetylglucosaminyl-diphospho-decaprenol L-rhamnosyltransferase
LNKVTTAEISVIIVNYNTSKLTVEAIESILAYDHGGAFVDIHLVDNASPNGDADVLKAAIKSRGWSNLVSFYPETTNHGFGRGNNLVLNILNNRDTPPDKVFFLNPDARLGNEVIEILAQFLDDHSQAGVVGARIEKPDNQPVTSAFRFPSLIGEFSRAVSFGPISRILSHWEVSLGATLPTKPVDWVAGAAVMAKLEALNKAGLFDPEYFLYFEEVDLMRQIKRLGWQTWHISDALVIHAEGAATGVKSGTAARKRRPAYWYHSWYYYFSKNHGRSYAILTGMAWISGAAINHLIALIRRKEPAAPAHFFHDFWAMAARPLLGLKARPYD